MPSFLPDSNTFERYGTTISAGENSSVIKIIYSFPLTDRFAIGTEVLETMLYAFHPPLQEQGTLISENTGEALLLDLPGFSPLRLNYG